MSDLPARRISVVTPTLDRPQEVQEMLVNLSQQSVPPYEVVLVDGAPPHVIETQDAVRKVKDNLPFRCSYIRHGGGTAIQRNIGIEAAEGDFVAFIDDDIRLAPDFFELMLAAYKEDVEQKVGGIAGYITNQYFDPAQTARWSWNKRLNLYTTYEPGRYDYQTGYPINRYMQPPHETLREIDFMGTNCAVWRRQVFDDGLRFSGFLTGFAVLEDAHLALRAKQTWVLLEYGKARCVHLKSGRGREDMRTVARKTAVNYRYVFVDIVPSRTLNQEFRFWRVQFYDLLRYVWRAVRSGGKSNWLRVIGKAEGILAAFRINDSAKLVR